MLSGLLAIACPTPGPAPGPSGSAEGITIEMLEAEPLDDDAGCFRVHLEYTIGVSKGGRLQVAYDWETLHFKVDGLQERYVTARGSEQVPVVETFDVCPMNPSPQTQMFAFSIGARQGPRVFKANPSVGFIRNAKQWARGLSGKISRLKDQIDGGERSPAILRDYYRSAAAYFHGGYNGWDAEVEADTDRLKAQFEGTPPRRLAGCLRHVAQAKRRLRGGGVRARYR